MMEPGVSGDFWGSQEGCQGPSRPSGRNRGLPLRRRRGQGHRRQPTRLPCPWDSPGKNAGVGCQSLLQGIFPTQGSNPCCLHTHTFTFNPTQSIICPSVCLPAHPLNHHPHIYLPVHSGSDSPIHPPVHSPPHQSIHSSNHPTGYCPALFLSLP